MAEWLFLELVDEADGRLLVVTGLDGGAVSFTVYRPGAVTSQYRVDLHEQQQTQLWKALLLHQAAVDAARGRAEGGR